MKRVTRSAGWLLLWVTAAAWPLWAQSSSTRREGNSWVSVVTGSLPAAKNLKVNTDNGSVTVRGGDASNISYTITKRVYTGSEEAARRAFEGFSLSAVQRGEFAVIEGASGGRGARRFSVDIAVNVPRSLNLVRVETDGGAVHVSGIAGRVEAGTGGGILALSDIGSSVTAHTSGGGIDVGNVGGDLKLETAGGAISIHDVKGRVFAQTAGGGIELRSATQGAVLESAGGCIEVKQVGGELRVSTAGGSVDVGDVAGAATLETSGGSIRLRSANGLVRANTSGGGIHLNHLGHGAIARTAAGPIYAEFVARAGSFTDSLLETSVGDVVVFLPPDLPVTVKASIDTAFGHTIRSEFPEIKVTSEGAEYGPREMYAQGALNGGGPVLKVRTSTGNIELRRLAAR